VRGVREQRLGEEGSAGEGGEHWRGRKSEVAREGSIAAGKEDR